MTRNLWIINHHAALPSKDGRAGRHHGLALKLENMGWDVTLVVASTSHPDGKQRLRGLKMREISFTDSVRSLVLRTNAYGQSVRLRFLGMAVFSAQALLPWSTSSLPKPDIIIGSTVHPLAAFAGERLAKRHKVPFVFEVRDVWPDYLVELGKVRKGGLLDQFFRRIMEHCLSQASLVVSPLANISLWTSEHGYADKATLWIPNGVDEAGVHLDDERLVSEITCFEFMYLGSLGPANAVETIISAFDLAARQAPKENMRLTIVGSGSSTDELQGLAAETKSAERISFVGRIPRSQVVAKAETADALLVAMADKPVYRFGISPNKIFDYLLSARPIIMSVSQPNPVEAAGAGMVTPADDVEAFAQAMVEMTSFSVEVRDAMGLKGKGHVVENYGYEKLARRLSKALIALVGDSPITSAETRFVSSPSKPLVGTKVAHISSAHPWFDNRIHFREAATLADAGADVRVIAVEDDVSGIIAKVPTQAYSRVSRFRRFTLGVTKAFIAGLASGAQVIHLHDPELIVTIPLFRILGRTVIYDAHEDLPSQVLGKSYVNIISRPLFLALSRGLVQAASHADFIVSATETIAMRFPSEKTSVVRNYPPLREVESSAAGVCQRPLNVVYIGGLSLSRGAEAMLSMVEQTAFPRGWTLQLAGEGSEAMLGVLQARPGWGLTKFHGKIAPTDARNMLLEARVGLCLLKPTPAYLDSLPTKMFEYFAAGLPVIASDFPLWRQIIDRWECGLVVDPDDPLQAAEALQRYADDEALLSLHSQNARTAAVSCLNWDSEGRTLIEMYTKVAAMREGLPK